MAGFLRKAISGRAEPKSAMGMRVGSCERLYYGGLCRRSAVGGSPQRRRSAGIYSASPSDVGSKTRAMCEKPVSNSQMRAESW